MRIIINNDKTIFATTSAYVYNGTKQVHVYHFQRSCGCHNIRLSPSPKLELITNFVAERDAITFTLVLLKGCEHPSLPRHMICVFTIKHPTCTTRGVSLQNKLGFCFRYPSLIGPSQVSDKALGHPHISL
jgi:hypothetical protein